MADRNQDTPFFEPSTDRVLPFRCDNCVVWFDDYPALIVVEIPGETLRYCSDDCADEDGWIIAVTARWDQEVSGGGMYLRYRAP